MTTATHELARMEARLMLRHPAPWTGAVLSALMAWNIWDEDWSGERYQMLIASVTPLLLGISLASVSAFGRELVPVADAAPMDRSRRSVARLVGALPLVGVAAVLIAGVFIWLRAIGGLTLGDEPGRTVHAHHTLPEMLQPVLLAVLAVAIGAAMVHVLRRRLAASILLALGWFLLGPTYWIFNGPVLTFFSPVQVQPMTVDIGPPETDPSTFPAGWLLTGPGPYQDYWGRVVVSPAMAAWHDVYLVGVIALAVAVAVPGRLRRPLVALGVVLVAAGVVMQKVVAP
ncbi:hypothetical protein HZF07_19585 [Nocardioides sp. CGMCC 1.13656]|uniref:hypothetical protein n=1 Tax=Nocardioides TaxID=1839 RepID=UPI0012FAD885|nr:MULTISPECIES: hypothetical protein [unclassified Nocardioides]MBA2955934.1 hypothetical protein [Nocardioides sp. CGMCC 1.13656]